MGHCGPQMALGHHCCLLLLTSQVTTHQWVIQSRRSKASMVFDKMYYLK